MRLRFAQGAGLLIVVVGCILGARESRLRPLVVRNLASLPETSVYSGCRDSSWGVEWQHAVGGRNYRCCTGAIIPDGIQYGGNWCKDGRLVRVLNHSCAFRVGAAATSVPGPIYGHIWYCDRSNGPAKSCVNERRPTTPVPGNAGVLIDTGLGLKVPGVGTGEPGPIPSRTPTQIQLSLPRGSQPPARTASMDPPVAGFYAVLNLQRLLDENPSNGTYLNYAQMDGDRIGDSMGNLTIQSEILEKNGRNLAPQLALEIHDHSLDEFIRDIQDPASEMRSGIQALARQIKEFGKRVYIRPFSEMNDGSAGATWELGNRERGNNTPAKLAKAWVLLHDLMDKEGATNALYSFAPLAARNMGRSAEMAETLRLIPRGYIDAFGLNVYTRPLSHYGGSSGRYVPFEELVKPWLKMQGESIHRGLPRMVPEMGCSTQGSDEERARWIREAFRYGKDHGFKAMTYFNASSKWSLPEGGLAAQALKESIETF